MFTVAVSPDKIKKKVKGALTLVGAFFLLNICYAQSIKGELIASSEYQYLYLDEVIGGIGYTIDSVDVSEGYYQFEHIDNPIGYYRLKFTEQNRIDFINDQRPIEINFGSTVLRNDLEVVKSRENMLLWQYKYYSRKTQQKEKKLSIEQSYLEKGNVEWTILQTRRDSITISKRNYLDELCEKDPNSVFTKLVGATQRTTGLTKEIEKSKYFDNIDFTDPILVRSSILPSQMMSYFQLYTDYSEGGFQESVDRILLLASSDDSNYEFCLNFILDLFNRVGPDVVFQYVVEKYLLDGGCSEVNVSEHITALAQNYRAIQPGNKAPMFTEKTDKGDSIVLEDYLKQNDFTVLFFWSSHCGFCSASTPKLIEWTKTKSNVQVLGISLDQDKNELASYLKLNSVPWDNISDLKGWKSDIVLRYKVHKTPAFYVLDSMGIIVSKPKDVLGVSELNLEMKD
jgi:peroxiredoxin